MTTLIEFLEERLREDEAAARATLIDVDGSGEWRADEHPVALTADLYRVRDVNARPVVEEIRSLDDDDDPDNITEYVNGAAVSQHVALHDPARVLREVTAKRALLEDINAEKHLVVDGDPYFTCNAATEERDGGESWAREKWGTACGCGRDDRVERRLKLLAAPYSDHPEFRKEWAV
jgi:hypothetical protein